VPWVTDPTTVPPVLGPIRPPYSLASPSKGLRHWGRACWLADEAARLAGDPFPVGRAPVLVDWSARSQVIQSVRDWWHLQRHPVWLQVPMTSHWPPMVPLASFADPLWLDHLPRGSGLVLDTRHLACLGLPLPLPDVLAEALRPLVVAVTLADMPTRAALTRAGYPVTADPHFATPWPPASSPRWSRARWRAMVAQWRHVPLRVPVTTDWALLLPDA
jgi:hypothetical protein